MPTVYPYDFIGPLRPGDYRGPVTRPTPQPNNQVPSSTPNYQVGGWYDGRQWDGSRLGNPGEVIVGNNSAGSQNSSSNSNSGYSIPSGPSDAELDAIYNPLISALDSQIGTARESAEGQKKLATQYRDDQLSNLGTKKEQELTTLEGQQDEFQGNLRSALEDAVRSYKALDQQARSRFGAGSSAGEAVGELARQEFFRNQGSLQKEEVRELGKIRQAKTAINLFFVEEEQRLNRDAQTRLTQIEDALRDTINGINTQRAGLESDRASKRLQALQQARVDAAQIQNQLLSEKRALDTWKTQQDYLLKQNLEQVSAQNYQFDPNAISQPTTSEISSATPSQGSGYSINQLSYNPNTKPAEEEDEGGFFDFLFDDEGLFQF